MKGDSFTVMDATKELYETYLACSEEDREDFVKFIQNPNEDTLRILGLPVICILYVTDFGDATPSMTEVRYESLANKLEKMIFPQKNKRRIALTEAEKKERKKEYCRRYYLAHKEKINDYNYAKYWERKNSKNEQK